MGEIGQKLRDLRKSRGITLRALAKEVGIHFSSISNIENGKERCGEETLTRIAEALGADVDLMLGEAGHRTLPYRVLGNIAAGTPNEAIENVETFDLSLVFDPRDHFMLKVRGDSMILDGINDGDMVIVKHGSRARNGQTVVAIVDGGEATLKKYVKKDRLVVLSPANRRMKAKTYPAGSVEIRGVLAGVVRTNVE
ncbi:MAG TPA: XRE family transcriptional regulator [Planctomycetes bacterium]|nr:XRE family transcriptional regulator [Fuerstiella sp.]HIK90582.1 XRE family transcriptional regulator [Planctomycetota bacterium]